MRDYVLRLLRANGEPALIYRTLEQGDDWVLARLLRIRSVRYDRFEVLRDGRKIADGPAATRQDEFGVLGTWPRAIRRLSPNIGI
jgi:hypothetical protein